MLVLPANGKKGREWEGGVAGTLQCGGEMASEIRNSESKRAVKCLRNPAGSEEDCSRWLGMDIK